MAKNYKRKKWKLETKRKKKNFEKNFYQYIYIYFDITYHYIDKKNHKNRFQKLDYKLSFKI